MVNVDQTEKLTRRKSPDFWINVKVDVTFELGGTLDTILRLHLKPPMRRPLLIPLMMGTLVIMAIFLILAIAIIAQQHYSNES